MSTEPNPYENFPAPTAKSGSKIWLWLGLGCGVMLLVCCGGIGGALFWAKSKFIKTEPLEVAKAAQEIATFDVPPGLEPAFAMILPLGEAGMKMVVFKGAGDQGGLFLMEMTGQNTGTDPEVMRAQLDAQLRAQQQGQGTHQLRIETSRKLEGLEIRGKPASFSIQKGKDAADQQFIQAIGTFEARTQGACMFMLQVPADKYSEDQVEQIIRTIK